MLQYADIMKLDFGTHIDGNLALVHFLYILNVLTLLGDLLMLCVLLFCFLQDI